MENKCFPDVCWDSASHIFHYSFNICTHARACTHARTHTQSCLTVEVLNAYLDSIIDEKVVNSRASHYTKT